MSLLCPFKIFIPIWWAWIGTIFYANRFDTDDISNRLLTGLQMLAIAALAVNVHGGLGGNSAGFALAYAVSRFILVFQYLRVIKHIPQARNHTIGFAIRQRRLALLIAAVLWFISAFIPIPLRFIFWGLGLGTGE